MAKLNVQVVRPYEMLGAFVIRAAVAHGIERAAELSVIQRLLAYQSEDGAHDRFQWRARASTSRIAFTRRALFSSRCVPTRMNLSVNPILRLQSRT